MPSLIPLLLLGAAIIFAWTVFLRAEDDQSKQELHEAEEKEKMLLLSQLQQEQVILRDTLQHGFQSPQQDRVTETKQRGIVICAGGNKLLINVFVSVKVLRDTLNCTLPIEIYHNGQEDVGPITRAAFKVFANVTFLDLDVLALPPKHERPKFYNGYVAKILSLFLTKFEQVLLLDADSQPLLDPASLFELDSFRQNGNIFWPDYWAEGFSESPHPEVYEWLQLVPPWNLTKGWQCAESGQVLIDKKRHADVLEWLFFLNSHAELLYKHMLGDKDTFEIAFMLAGKHSQFHRVPISPGVPLSKMYKNIHQGSWRQRFMKKDEARRYLRVGVIQYSDLGVPAFMHRTERTKFASWRDGYSLEVMRPVFVLPSFGPDISAQAKEAVWNLHSLPEGLVSENCTCCALNPGTRAVLERLAQPSGGIWSAPTRQHGSVEAVLRANITQGCMWSSKTASLSKFPLLPVSAFGQALTKPLDAGFTAYETIERILGAKIKSTLSP